MSLDINRAGSPLEGGPAFLIDMPYWAAPKQPVHEARKHLEVHFYRNN